MRAGEREKKESEEEFCRCAAEAAAAWERQGAQSSSLCFVTSFYSPLYERIDEREPPAVKRQGERERGR